MNEQSLRPPALDRLDLLVVVDNETDRLSSVDVYPDRPDQRGTEVLPGVMVTLPADPTLDAPGHCTGWRAKTELQHALPDRYGPSVVGSASALAAPSG